MGHLCIGARVVGGIARDITGLIGNTPLVELRRLTQLRGARVLGKLESRNPSGSVKDRVVWAILEDAERRGALARGDAVVEASAGNAAISLAMLGAALGYHAVAVMPESAPVERRRVLVRLGAEVRLTDPAAGMAGAHAEARRLGEGGGWFHLDQFGSPMTARVHRETTAREILAATGGEVDAFVAGVGTGGTITGVGEALREALPSVLVVAVEPRGSPLLTHGHAGEHGIPGLGPDFLPPALNRGVIDEVIAVTDRDAARVARQLIEEEGLFLGVSSGASTAAALRIAHQLGPGKTVVTVWPDSGERYASAPL